jgi:hypothetical protein
MQGADGFSYEADAHIGQLTFIAFLLFAADLPSACPEHILVAVDGSKLKAKRTDRTRANLLDGGRRPPTKGGTKHRSVPGMLGDRRGGSGGNLTGTLRKSHQVPTAEPRGRGPADRKVF